MVPKTYKCKHSKRMFFYIFRRSGKLIGRSTTMEGVTLMLNDFKASVTDFDMRDYKVVAGF